MVSATDKSKRALVTLIRSLALLYGCCVTVSRESLDTDMWKAYRTVSKKVHPDRGGTRSASTLPTGSGATQLSTRRAGRAREERREVEWWWCSRRWWRRLSSFAHRQSDVPKLRRISSCASCVPRLPPLSLTPCPFGMKAVTETSRQQHNISKTWEECAGSNRRSVFLSRANRDR